MIDLRKVFPCGLLAVAGLSTALAQTTESLPLRPPDTFTSLPAGKPRATALFEEAGKVIQHPRCVNCHPRTDRPLQGMEMRPHQPLVVRGAAGHGAVAMPCTTCHGSSNYTLTQTTSIPGHEKWGVAPLSMAWEGKSLGQICQQIKDPKRNGGKSLKQIVDHMANDSLVGWGWDPGAGRTPAPGTQKQFGALIQAWVDAGAHCPT